jgi:hypothetical protein
MTFLESFPHPRPGREHPVPDRSPPASSPSILNRARQNDHDLLRPERERLSDRDGIADASIHIATSPIDDRATVEKRQGTGCAQRGQQIIVVIVQILDLSGLGVRDSHMKRNRVPPQRVQIQRTQLPVHVIGQIVDVHDISAPEKTAPTDELAAGEVVEIDSAVPPRLPS